MLDIETFSTRVPELYKSYRWSSKHHLFGYSEDRFPDFEWIGSLEKRFGWPAANYEISNTSSKYLILEMIEWGRSQSGVLKKLENRSGEVNLFHILQEIIENIDSPRDAIVSALKVPGFGLSYASKLRFLNQKDYGALDNQIRDDLRDEGSLRRIYDGNVNSVATGYVEFLSLIGQIRDELLRRAILKPTVDQQAQGSWRASDIEMALFCWSTTR